MIREATAADAALVQELWLAFNAEIPDAPWRDPDEDDFSPDVVLLADDDGAIALSRHGSRTWFADVLYVRPDARGRGLGAALLRAAAERIGADGVLELEVLESNPEARRLYERLGFETVDRTLAAPASTLLAEEVGPTYGAVHVQSDDADLVRRNAAKVLRAEPDVTLGSGWVRVNASPDTLRTLARELSFTTGVALSLAVEDGAVVRYVLFDRGSLVDEYASVPEFRGPLPPGDVVALGANATVVARLTGADPQRVRAVARTGASPRELPPADDLYRQIAEVLGVEVE
ncbi:MAG TPA: GNAT family N-acetyltransferase [Gaiellaceae bacterium]